MKMTKAEKIWLALSVIFYFLYNLPGFPEYLDPTTSLYHGAATVIPLWIIAYVGMGIIYRVYELKDKDGE